MAGEVLTTTSTLAGLMQTAQADLVAMFQSASRCFGFGWTETPMNAKAVNFPVYPSPSPVTEHTTEADDPSKTAVTINNQLVTIGVFPYITTFSKLSEYGGDSIPQAVLLPMANGVAAGVDKEFCSNFTSFTTEVAGVDSLSKLTYAVGQLQETGYNGEIRCVLSHTTAMAIITDAGTKFIPNTNDAQFNSGKLGRIVGIGEIRCVPKTWLPTNAGGKYVGAVWYHGVGIGEGCHPPLVHFTNVEKHVYSELGATAYYRAEKLSATGGIALAMP